MINITHIHPMLVHFPIVLFITTVVIYLAIIIRKGDLAVRECLSLISLITITAGVAMAVLAAFFGDIALDAALDKGFDKIPLEEHEELAILSIIFFSVIALVQGFSMWKGNSLAGIKAVILFIVSLIGLGLLFIAAYHGGELVYEIGVNVTPVKP